MVEVPVLFWLLPNVCTFLIGGVKWDSAVYQLERSGFKKSGRKSSWWYGDEEMGVLNTCSNNGICCNSTAILFHGCCLVLLAMFFFWWILVFCNMHIAVFCKMFFLLSLNFAAFKRYVRMSRTALFDKYLGVPLFYSHSLNWIMSNLWSYQLTCAHVC